MPMPMSMPRRILREDWCSSCTVVRVKIVRHLSSSLVTLAAIVLSLARSLDEMSKLDSKLDDDHNDDNVGNEIEEKNITSAG